MAQSRSSEHMQHAAILDARRWVKHYERGVPAEVDVPDITLPQMLRRTAERFPRKTFATFYGRDFTYGEIDEQSDRFAHRLIELGVEPRSESTRLNSSHVKTSYAVFCLKNNMPTLYNIYVPH